MKNRFVHLFAAIALSMASMLAGAGSFTDYAENKLVDALFRGQTLGTPTTWYVGLDTVSCTETGGGTEVTGGSYARVAVTASLANFAGTQSAGSTTASSRDNFFRTGFLLFINSFHACFKLHLIWIFVEIYTELPVRTNFFNSLIFFM